MGYLREMRSVVRALGWPGFLLAAGGAGALAEQDHLLSALTLCSLAEGCVLANNLYSSDVVGLREVSNLDAVQSIRSVNDLAWALSRDASLVALPLPFSEAWDFDLDTPSDLSVLAFLGRTAVRSVPTAQVQRVADVLADPTAVLLVAGRVSSRTMAALDRHAKCQVRTLSEERGMKASGRERAGLVRSVLIDEGADPVELAHRLLSVASALVLDTRFLVASAKWKIADTDLFAADWFAIDEIATHQLRAFVWELEASRKPVLLGGHNLVNSGLRQIAYASHQTGLQGCSLCVA